MIIERIIIQTSHDRRHIQALAQPVGMSASGWELRRARLRRERLEVAIKMVRVILDKSIWKVRYLDEGQTVRTLADTDEYKY